MKIDQAKAARAYLKKRTSLADAAVEGGLAAADEPDVWFAVELSSGKKALQAPDGTLYVPPTEKAIDAGALRETAFKAILDAGGDIKDAREILRDMKVRQPAPPSEPLRVWLCQHFSEAPPYARTALLVATRGGSQKAFKVAAPVTNKGGPAGWRIRWATEDDLVLPDKSLRGGYLDDGDGAPVALVSGGRLLATVREQDLLEKQHDSRHDHERDPS